MVRPPGPQLLSKLPLVVVKVSTQKVPDDGRTGAKVSQLTPSPVLAHFCCSDKTF